MRNVLAFFWKQAFPYWNKSLPVRIGKNAWKYRTGYYLLNGLMLIWILQLNGTGLWKKQLHYLAPDDAELNTGTATLYFIVIVLSWLVYFIVQASDPGYLTRELLAKSGFDAETGAMVDQTRTFLRNEEKEDVGDVELTGFDGRSNRADDENGDLDLEEKRDPVVTRYRRHQQIDDESEERRLLSRKDNAEGDDFVESVIEDEMRARVRFGLKHLPLRSRWCRRSKRFVAKYDHFCTVMNTCIGERNHCTFWWYLFLQSLAAMWTIALVMDGVQYRSSWGNWIVDNGQHLACLTILWSAFLVVFTMCGFHTFLAASNMTSYELNKGSRIDYLADFDECDLPFSGGLCSNLKIFCCIFGGETFADASWRPKIWKAPDKFNRNSRDICNNLWENKYWKCC